MKIGILTFHEADSYGAVLQAYALQQTLKELGADSEFVQIHMPPKPQPAPTAAAPAAALFAKRIQAEGKKREALFADFRARHMAISRPYAPTDPIDGDYDCFIAGSDQIWNFRIPGADARYFLPFAAAEKRYSYAASFGADALPEKVRDWVAKQLSQFSGISVREASGCSIVEELTGKTAEVCLDPTLLPDRVVWESLAAETDTEDYVLLFLLKYDEALVEKAKEEAEKLGFPLKTVTAGFMPQIGMAAWNTTGVTDWLTAIRNASCVFTNSFHGMVFSMIFRRSFRIQLLDGELSSRNGRLVEMLGSLNLSEALETVITPDYDRVWEQMQPRRNASLEYLKRIVCRNAL